MSDADPTPDPTPGDPHEAEPADGRTDLWFERRPGGLGIGPVNWQGRATTFLFVFLVLVAVITYSELAITAFVIVFYLVVFGFVVVVKSDLLDDWPPKS